MPGMSEREEQFRQAVAAVLDVSNVRVDSEFGDPAFVAGWESALEEVNERIKEALGGKMSDRKPCDGAFLGWRCKLPAHTEGPCALLPQWWNIKGLLQHMRNRA